MRRLHPLSLSLAALAALALSCLGYAAEPTATPDCQRLARAGDEKIQVYCGDPGREATGTPGATFSAERSCRRFVPPGDAKIQTYCGGARQWADFDRQAITSEVTCRWAGTSQELCLTPVQWESFDRNPNRDELARADPSRAPRADAELVVSANRTLAELRRQITATEDRFLAKYNALNKIPDFAISCHEEATIGSRLRNHVCRAKFVESALTLEGRGFLFAARQGEMGGSYDPSAVGSAAQKQTFEKNMIDIASNSPELSKLAQERGNLGERYNRLLRRAFGAKD